MSEVSLKQKSWGRSAGLPFHLGWGNQAAERWSFQSKVSHRNKDEWFPETRARRTRTIFNELNLSIVENASSKNFKSVFTLPLGYFHLEISHSNLLLNVSVTQHSPSNCLSSLVPDFSKKPTWLPKPWWPGSSPRSYRICPTIHSDINYHCWVSERASLPSWQPCCSQGNI